MTFTTNIVVGLLTFSALQYVYLLEMCNYLFQKKKGEKTPTKHFSAPSLNTGGFPQRLDPLPGSPLHDERFNPTKPLPQPTFKKFIKWCISISTFWWFRKNKYWKTGKLSPSVEHGNVGVTVWYVCLSVICMSECDMYVWVWYVCLSVICMSEWCLPQIRCVFSLLKYAIK